MGPGSIGARSNMGSVGGERLLSNRTLVGGAVGGQPRAPVMLKREKQSYAGYQGHLGGTLATGSSYPSMRQGNLGMVGPSSLQARQPERKEFGGD